MMHEDEDAGISFEGANAEVLLAAEIHAAMQAEHHCVLMSRVFDPEYPEETIDGAYDLRGVARRLLGAIPRLKECLVSDPGYVAKGGIEGRLLISAES